MSLSDGYIEIPVVLLVAESAALMDISIYMPVNQKTVLYRRAGDPLSLDDVMHLRDKAVTAVMKQEDYQPAMQRLAGTLNDASSPAVGQALAKGVLGGMSRDPETPVEIKRAELDAASDFAKTLLTSNVKITGSDYYDKILAGLQGDDQYSTHNRHVGALAAMIMMAIGGSSSAEVADVTFAGFFHDLLLPDLPKAITEPHLSGEDLGTLVSKAPALNLQGHIARVLETFRLQNIPVSAGAVKAIAQHHENFDGSGLHGERGEAICKPARILRVADDMISLFDSPKKKQSLASAYATLENFNEKMKSPIYDPGIIAKLEPVFG